jgi:hypothetical protein
MKGLIMQKILSASLLVMSLASCDEQKFKADHAQRPDPKPLNHVIKVMGLDEESDGGKKQLQTIDTLDLIIQGADDRKLSEITETIYRPVDLYFVLDSSGSMQEEINVIRSAINRIVDQLSAKGIELHVGVVGFVDSTTSMNSRTLALTGDIASFKNFLTSMRVQSNADASESALMAVQKAVELLKTGPGRPNALKAIVTITDVVGHNGGPEGTSTRDCSIDQTVNAINSYVSSISGSTEFRFFYDVPDPAFNNSSSDQHVSFQCNGFNAKTQMEAILNNITTDKPVDQRGAPLLNAAGRLNWPLTETGLVNNLVPLLQSEINSDVTGSCLAKSAELFSGAEKLYSWQAANLEDIYNGKTGANELELKNVLGKQRQSGTQDLTLKVQRCCLTEESIATKKFGQCDLTFTQSIKYEILNVNP